MKQNFINNIFNLPHLVVGNNYSTIEMYTDNLVITCNLYVGKENWRGGAR